MIRRTLLMLMVGVLMTGCGSSPDLVYRKPGVTEDQRERDKSDCVFASMETVPGGYGASRRLDTDRYQRCMENRGYTLEKAAD